MDITPTPLSSSSSRNQTPITRKNETVKESDDDAVVVERKIAALQRIVPGGENLVAEELFEETAEYILALQSQVKALRFLVEFVGGSDEKKKRKLVG